MALEKRTPLPAGRYWADVFDGAKKPAFEAWKLAWQTAGLLKILGHQRFNEPPLSGTPGRDWYLFQITKSDIVSWPAKDIGFWPTIADASVTSSADTASRPSFEVLEEQSIEDVRSATSKLLAPFTKGAEAVTGGVVGRLVRTPLFWIVSGSALLLVLGKAAVSGAVQRKFR